MFLHDLLFRLRSLMRHSAAENELDDELRSLVLALARVIVLHARITPFVLDAPPDLVAVPMLAFALTMTHVLERITQ